MNPDATVQLPAGKVKTKVLLVEDEANIASMVVEWLSEHYDVRVAENGRKALQMAGSEKPAIILQDINLPDMTGYDVVKLLEKDSATSGIPVIFLTGEKMVEETVKFIATVKNVRGYVNKPFRLKDFLEKVALVLSNKAEFVVMEHKSSSPESLAKADRLRDARASSAEPSKKSRPIKVPEGPMGTGMGGKGFFRRLFSGIFSLIFWLLWAVLGAGAAVELTWRFAEGLAGSWIFVPPPLRSGADAVPGTWDPGSSWVRNGVDYRFNSLGLRDVEPAARSTGTFHAVVLGGTAVFGQDVPASDTFPKRLETLMNNSALFASTGAHHVLSAGLWGVPSGEQWAAYERLRPAESPDLVLWVAGDGPVRRPSRERLQLWSRLPPEVRPWLEKSRLAGFLEVVFLYGAPPEKAAPDDLAARLDRFMTENSSTTVVVLKLAADAGVENLPTKEKLLVADLSKVMALDLTWRGLTPRGHEYMSRAVMPVLQRYKDRIKPPPPAPEKSSRNRRR